MRARAQVHDEAAARVRVAFEAGANEGYQFKTHPNIDKQLYARNILGLRDAERPFISGDILKWRMQARAAPLHALPLPEPLATPCSAAS